MAGQISGLWSRANAGVPNHFRGLPSIRNSPTPRVRITGSGLGGGLASQMDFSGLLQGVNPQDWADRASVDVGSAYDKAQGINTRAMSRMGVNPNSPRFAGLIQDVNLRRAASEAGEVNRARRAADDVNYARKRDVAGLMMQQGMHADRMSLAQPGFDNSASYNRNKQRQADRQARKLGMPGGINPRRAIANSYRSDPANLWDWKSFAN
jgi:hypothetical protein